MMLMSRFSFEVIASHCSWSLFTQNGAGASGVKRHLQLELRNGCAVEARLSTHSISFGSSGVSLAAGMVSADVYATNGRSVTV